MNSNTLLYYKYPNGFLNFKSFFNSPMKISILMIFLVYFAPIFLNCSFAFSSSFHRNLPENRREEITIVDDFTVAVGLGPDQQTVSCTILDAIGSLPSVDGEIEPDVVYVNNEMVHHIRKGLYTWDREGKYRVRLTSKYIRQFGDILVWVPDPTGTQPVIEKLEGFTSYFYQTLPENKREEITIIDPYMVEVGLGPDLNSVSSILQDAIRSIPKVKKDSFPEFVNVNNEPIFFIGNGLYSWDAKGFNPVRLSATYIHKFGNIRVSIPGKLSFPLEKEKVSIVWKKRKTPATFSTKKIINVEDKKADKTNTVKQSLKEKKTGDPKKEIISKANEPTKTILPAPSPPSPLSTGENFFGLKGFRLAHFGMNISQVKKAIQGDFNIDESLIKVTGQEENIIAISTNKLSSKGGIASVQYLFKIKDKTLTKIHIIWEASENTNKLATKLTKQFLNTRFLEKQSHLEGDHLYFGKDSYGNKLMLSWANPTKNLFNKRPLKLTYAALVP